MYTMYIFTNVMFITNIDVYTLDSVFSLGYCRQPNDRGCLCVCARGTRELVHACGSLSE